MLEGLPARVLMDPAVDPLVVRRVQLAEGLGRAERAVLRAEIVAADVGDLDRITDPGVDLFEVAQRDVDLLGKHLVQVVLPGDRRHVPLLDVANPARLLQHRRRDQRDVADRRAAQVAGNAVRRILQLGSEARQTVQLGSGDVGKFLGVLVGVEVVFVKRLLPDDRVEEVARLRHLGRRRVVRIAVRIDEDLFVVFGGNELLGNEHFLAPGRHPLLEVLVPEPEHRARRPQRLGVDAEHFAQVVVDHAEHLVRAEHDRRALLQPVVRAQAFEHRDVDARRRHGTEIERNRTRLVVERQGHLFF